MNRSCLFLIALGTSAVAYADDPPEPVCPDCPLHGKNLYVHVDAGLEEGSKVVDGELVLWCPEVGEIAIGLSPELGTLAPGDATWVKGLPIDADAPWEQATVALHVVGPEGESRWSFDPVEIVTP